MITERPNIILRMSKTNRSSIVADRREVAISLLEDYIHVYISQLFPFKNLQARISCYVKISLNNYKNTTESFDSMFRLVYL